MSSSKTGAAVSEAKASLRKSLLRSRPHSSSDLTERLLSLVQATEAKRVGCYVALPEEPDTLPFIRKASDSQMVEIYTPAIVGDSMRWRRYLGVLSPGKFGIGESNGPNISASDLDLIILPALAASPKGQRLGRGGGFFDRELSNIRKAGGGTAPITAAIVFDVELLNTVPAEEHDQRVDFVVTPTKTISTEAEAAN